MSLLRITNPTDFYTEVAKGNVVGHSAINKFGHNNAATSGDDVWGGGGTYVFYPTAAVAVDIISTSTADDTGGTGGIQVTVTGLDVNWEEASETITLNGTAAVQLSTAFVRMYRAFVYEAGTGNVNAGDITVYARATGSGVTAGDIGIFIGASEGQTQHAIYTVPAGKNGYFVKGYVAVASDKKVAEAALFQWKARMNNGVNGAWLIKGEVGLNTLGSSSWQYLYGLPAGPLPPKTDLRIETATMTATMGVVGGFDILLVDE